MLRSTNEIISYSLKAKDGEIGKCKDFLFDEDRWTIRYMVADTGKWLPGKKVLISPISLGIAEWKDQRFHINLTKKQIEESPPLDSDASVSRKYERFWFKYFGLSPYWHGGEVWGSMAFPEALPLTQEGMEEYDESQEDPDPHLRSCREVMGYHVEASDGEIGHIKDFIMKDETWSLFYLVIETRNILPGKKVIVSPEWVESIDWRTKKIALDMTRDQIKDSPEFDPSMPVNREYEVKLYDYYGRPKYWSE